MNDDPSGADGTWKDRFFAAEQMLATYKNALDQASIVAITDVKGDIVFANDKFCEISKYPREELLGRNHRILNSRHHPREFFINLWKTISSGKVWRGEIRNRAKDESLYWVDTTIVPFLNEKGRPYQYCAIRTDITSRKETEARLEHERMRSMHAEKMASLGEMAAGIAHELGNPLAALHGRIEFLELLDSRGTLTPEETQKTRTTMKELCQRMERIIRGMRSFAREGSSDPFEPASIERLIQDTLELTMEKMRKLGVEVTIGELPKDDQLICREAQIAQVLVNLINNARDAAAESAARWIRVDAAAREDRVEISVQDSGPGIPESIRSRIMDPFFTTKAVGSGTGLGLSISRAIVEDHGGTLTLDDASPHTRFVIQLPKKRKPR